MLDPVRRTIEAPINFFKFCNVPRKKFVALDALDLKLPTRMKCVVYFTKDLFDEGPLTFHDDESVTLRITTLHTLLNHDIAVGSLFVFPQHVRLNVNESYVGAVHNKQSRYRYVTRLIDTVDLQVYASGVSSMVLLNKHVPDGIFQ